LLLPSSLLSQTSSFMLFVSQATISFAGD
jgi:hypothetical protein